MLLVIDIGNTNINFGLFDNDDLKFNYKIPSDKNLSLNEYQNLIKDLFNEKNITKCIICSVVNELNQIIKKSCDEIFNINSILLTPKSYYDMKFILKNPESIGLDRIVNASKVKKDYSLPIIIVDIGTATTIDAVSQNGDFIGGAILPGINLQFKALNINTSKLPEIKDKTSPKAIGDSTETAIQSGVIRGLASAIEGLIAQFETELNENATIIATGGDCEIISKYMQRKFDYIKPNLTLESLKYLYEINKEQY